MILLRVPDRLARNNRLEHLSLQKLLGWDTSDVAVQDHKISDVSRQELSFRFLREFRVGRILCVSSNGLVNGQLLFREIFLSSRFILACHRSVESSEGSERLDGVVGAERQMHARI